MVVYECFRDHFYNILFWRKKCAIRVKTRKWEKTVQTTHKTCKPHDCTDFSAQTKMQAFVRRQWARSDTGYHDAPTCANCGQGANKEHSGAPTLATMMRQQGTLLCADGRHTYAPTQGNTALKNVPRWRRSVPTTVGAQQCSPLAHTLVLRRRIKVFTFGAKSVSTVGVQWFPLSPHKCVHCRRPNVFVVGAQGSTARKSSPCWRISVPTICKRPVGAQAHPIGAQEYSLLPQKRARIPQDSDTTSSRV